MCVRFWFDDKFLYIEVTILFVCYFKKSCESTHCQSKHIRRQAISSITLSFSFGASRVKLD